MKRIFEKIEKRHIKEFAFYVGLFVLAYIGGNLLMQLIQVLSE